MKKVLSIILAIVLIFGIFPHGDVYAKMDLEENLESIVIKMKNIFSIQYDYENFDSRINTSNDKINYSLNWRDNSKDIPDITIEVDGDENIIYYNKNYKRAGIDEFKNIGKNQAMDISLDFIEKIAPDKKNEIKEIKYNRNINNPQDNIYTINFYREVDGIPYYDNTLEIGIDKYREEVVNFYVNWDYDMEFPKKEDAIKIQEAQEILKKEIGLELIYKVKRSMEYYGEDRDREFYLVYDFLNPNKAVDAITGDIIDAYRNMPMYGNGGGMDEAATEESLNPEEIEEIEKLSGIKDIEEIESAARSILEIDDEYKLKEKDLSSSWKNQDEYIWNLYFVKDGEESNSISISLNAKTEDLISFYKYEDLKDKEATINREEALKLAKEYIQKMAPDKVNKVEYMPMEIDSESKIFDFRFIRKQEEIYVEEDNIYVGINAIDKQVYSYSESWFNEKLPPKGSIIDKERAYEVLFNEIGYELMYIKIWDSQDEDNREKIKLIYDTPRDKFVSIDAKTGKLLDSSGEEYIPIRDINYKDIDNSYAKDKINAIGEYGIGFREENFRPKEDIIQRDFLNLIWQYINPYIQKTEDTDKMYRDLIDRGIVKEEEKNPDEVVTKEQGVVFIIRAMNYEEVAELKGIYAEIFTDTQDIEEDFIGYMNIAYGFKIIEGDGNTPPKLNPKNKLKREDGANIIYNFIFR